MSSVNLRGIGAGSTLVLLNGRRVANYAFEGGAVDVNSIPLAAIDRVEILKDGASAIYGTDAIAGVINFILRKDFRASTRRIRRADGARRRRPVPGECLPPAMAILRSDRFNAFVDRQLSERPGAERRRQAAFRARATSPPRALSCCSSLVSCEHLCQRMRVAFSARAGEWLHATGLASDNQPLPTEHEAVCGFDAHRLLDMVPPVERTAVLRPHDVPDRREPPAVCRGWLFA